MKRVVIVAAKRTPFGRFRGGLADFSPVELGVEVGEAVLSGLDRSWIDQVIIGNVLSAGHGMNIARQISVQLRLPLASPAATINMMCGSGMQSALMGVTAIRAGESRVVLTGGTESMSQSALLVRRPGKGQSPDIETAVDSMQSDGLVDSFDRRHMGEQAEELAMSFGISRGQQDAFAMRSQHLYGVAHHRGAFDSEVIPVGTLRTDQHPRPEITQADLSPLKPVFRSNGTVTAGNSSGVNDGAALVLLAERDFAILHGWPILAEWIDGVAVGCEPSRMGLGPVHAVKALMQRTSATWHDIDTLEINEAFASQTLACLHGLNLSLDDADPSSALRAPDGYTLQFNSEGGAIALGHPLAASGARLLCHLAWAIHQKQAATAIGALCIGGGMGIAAMLKRHL